MFEMSEQHRTARVGKQLCFNRKMDLFAGFANVCIGILACVITYMYVVSELHAPDRPRRVCKRKARHKRMQVRIHIAAQRFLSVVHQHHILHYLPA